MLALLLASCWTPAIAEVLTPTPSPAVTEMIQGLSDNAKSHFGAKVAEQAMGLVDQWYGGHALDAFFGNINGGRPEAAKHGGDMPYIYGEFRPSSLADALATVGAKPGMKFYDLGSGTGKLVTTARLLGLDATGIELVPGRYTTACEHLKQNAMEIAKQLRSHGSDSGHAKFIHASFLEQDWADADIILADSVEWPKDLMGKASRMAQQLKPGSYIISSKPFSVTASQCFEAANPSTISMDASWAKGSVLHVQKVNACSENQSGPSSSPSHNLLRGLPNSAELCDVEGDEPTAAS